jgi:hypothetical protein
MPELVRFSDSLSTFGYRQGCQDPYFSPPPHYLYPYYLYRRQGTCLKQIKSSQIKPNRVYVL